MRSLGGHRGRTSEDRCAGLGERDPKARPKGHQNGPRAGVSAATSILSRRLPRHACSSFVWARGLVAGREDGRPSLERHKLRAESPCEPYYAARADVAAMERRRWSASRSIWRLRSSPTPSHSPISTWLSMRSSFSP
jgi:hypothetical protein